MQAICRNRIVKLKNGYNRKLLLYKTGAISAVLVSVFSLFLYAGHWLHYSDSPEKSDAIIILAGNPARAFYAADLYLQGYSADIYISKPLRLSHERLLDDIGVFFPFAEEIYRQVLLKKGALNSRIHILGTSSISTIEEAEAAKALFKGGHRKLLIVTSFYHVRRTKMIFKDVLKGYDIKVVGTPYESFPERWWTNQDAARDVLLETVKILFYKLGGSFHSRQTSAT